MLEAFYGFGVASASDFETEQEERLGFDDSNEKDSIPKGLHATDFSSHFVSNAQSQAKFAHTWSFPRTSPCFVKF